jgi:hypothetical protein
MTKPIQPESVEVTSLWKPASEMHAKLGWPYDFEEIEAIRDQARKMSDDDATMEAVAAVMQIADSRHRIASTTPTDATAVENERGLDAAIRAAELALFVIRKQNVMPNSSWEHGFNSDLALAKASRDAIRARTPREG